MSGIRSGTASTRWIVGIVRTAPVEIGVLSNARNGTYNKNHLRKKKGNGWPLLNDLRLGFNWRLTEGGGSGPSTTTPPDAPEDCVLGFNVRLTEGGEKGVMGRSAGLGLAKGNGLARFE